MMSDKTLNELFNQYQSTTDKNKDGIHFYGPTYDKLLSPFKTSNINILVIGVSQYGGGDVRSYLDYFDNALIWGIDNHPLDIKHPRFNFIIGDAYDSRTVLKDKQFHIIIDDCLHTGEKQCKALELYLPLLTSDGIYIIEDIRPEWESFIKNFQVVAGNRKLECIDLTCDQPKAFNNRLFVIK